MDPSAKGSIVMGVVAALRSLRKQGRVRDEQLAARLSPATLALFEQKVELGRWYPMAAFAGGKANSDYAVPSATRSR